MCALLSAGAGRACPLTDRPQSYSKYSGDDPQVAIWDRDFEKIWGFRVVLVADQWRQSQAKEKLLAQTQQQQQQQQRETAQPKLPTPPRQPKLTTPPHQHQQQAYRPRDSPPSATASSKSSSKSSSNSPTSAHSSPRAFAHAQPYEGRQGNPRALLRTHVSLSDLDAAAHPPAQEPRNLPSLKASGLLDSWKPPSEAFASSLSLAPPGTPRDAGPAPPRVSPTQGATPLAAAAAPAGLDWLADTGGGVRP